jgi:urease accessory protein
MSAASLRSEAPHPGILPCPPPSLQRGRGTAELAFVRRGDATVLAHLYQSAPCRVLFPRPETGDLPVAVLLTTSGGLAGGDTLRLQVELRDGAAVTVTSQAAEKIYRSLGPESRIDSSLTVAGGAWLDWLPQETILFDGARLRRRMSADIAPTGRLLACEMVVFGRRARGERYTHGLLHDAWRIRRGGKLVWADALHLEGDAGGELSSAMGFGDPGAFATLLYVGADAGDFLPLLREAVEADGGGASLVNGVLLVRFLAPRAEAVRAALTRCLGRVRCLAGWSERLPRVWHT